MGLGSQKNWRGAEGKVKILSTIAQIGDLAKEVGGERVEARVLIQGDLDPHSYEIVKGDSELLEGADLIFYNGLGLEHGASLFSALQKSPKGVAIGEKIRERFPKEILMRDQVVDPHIWMDISLWQKGVEPMVEALILQDPQGEEHYRKRGEALLEKMERAHLELKAQLQAIPQERRYLVTSHDAFHYFTRSYLAEAGEEGWERRVAAPEGLAPEGQLSLRTLQEIMAYLKDKRIGVLFSESNVSHDSIRKVQTAGAEMGLEIQICSEPLYGDAPCGHLYLEMMQKNGQTIAKYLLCGQ